MSTAIAILTLKKFFLQKEKSLKKRRYFQEIQKIHAQFRILSQLFNKTDAEKSSFSASVLFLRLPGPLLFWYVWTYIAEEKFLTVKRQTIVLSVLIG
ncbi:hypothetical protein AUO94_04830 [Planococcus kocurii]|uniref:Uncharacterized protein n=1 Tax=Planococcus kocurii TaxID=1374 RepID=A0ABN4JSZ8_9BACL|nr:hypothetical protein AUO94_04830 [Planococcus kocurii]